MQGHKRTARSERHHQDGMESAGNTSLIAKKNPSVRGEDDMEEVEDAGNTGADGGFANATISASYRLLESSAGIDPQVVYHNLWLFIWLKTIGSFDSGAFSAALGAENGIGATWQLALTQQGVLASSVFLGNVIGCPLAGHLFSRYNEKQVLCGSLVVHTVFTFLFAAMPSYTVALVNRFFIGLSLSFIVVYTPVWVDEFAPKNRQSVWMASHNAGVPLGIMFGYFMAVGPQMLVASIGWNWAFFIKCLLMIPTITYVARVDSHTINTTKAVNDDGKEDNNAAAAAAPEEDQPSASPTTGTTGSAALHAATVALNTARERANRALSTPIGEAPRALFNAIVSLNSTVVVARCRYAAVGFYSFMVPLLGNAVYICSVISLTSLYFVATGLQNFVTPYLQEPPFSASMATIMVGFGSAVVTAPVCGVIAGGILLDRIGGYKRNLRRVTAFLFAWGGCAVLFSVLCIFASTTRTFLLLMSVVLFCGGALIPPGAGLTMASLPDHLRSTGAAFSQTIYNLLGNFSGPLVCGWVAEQTGQLRYGIVVLLLCSSLGVLPLFGILCIACRDGPLPNGLGAGGGLADGASGGDAMAVEEDEEMSSVEGETAVAAAGASGAKELHVVEGTAVPTPPPPRATSPQQQTPPPPREQLERSRHQDTEPELPPTTTRREVASFEGLTNGGGSPQSKYAAPPPALPGPARPPLPRTSPTSVASIASGATPASQRQPQLPQQQQKEQPSPLPSAVHAWGTGRSGLQGPGTAHPVKVPAGSIRTTPAQNAPETTPGAVTDLELRKLESEAAQVLSVPSEQAYGMDLVRSWLSTQDLTLNAEGASGVVSEK